MWPHSDKFLKWLNGWVSIGNELKGMDQSNKESDDKL